MPLEDPRRLAFDEEYRLAAGLPSRTPRGRVSWDDVEGEEREEVYQAFIRTREEGGMGWWESLEEEPRLHLEEDPRRLRREASSAMNAALP